MRSHRSMLGTALLTVALLGTAGAVPAGAVSQPHAVTAPSSFGDGSFETPLATAYGFTTLEVGRDIGPWRVTHGTVDLIGAGFWAAADGDQSVDLSGYQAGAVTQTFATRPGARYLVNYALAGNPAGAPTVKTGLVRVNGLDVQDFSFDTTGKTVTDMGYSTQGFEFVASYPQTVLSFVSTTPTGYGPVLDGVTVTPVCCESCGG
ncbi:choice-of-anchor C family protein [Kitasatospora sp. NPDC002227]|uniref:choice-of-anchor C family protein n=1 Tax=Kitasatospora sp. NPDC002227 TaxID=3154773 RepID=UPI0033322800